MTKRDKTTMLAGAAWMGVVWAASAAMAVTLTACSGVGETAIEEVKAETRLITFHVKGGFDVSCTEFGDDDNGATRAGVKLEEDNTAGITDLWVLDYQNEGTEETPQWTLKQKVHQSATDEGFGHPTMEMSYGKHSLKLIASKGDEPVLNAEVGTDDGHQLTWAKVKDTFVLDYPIEVTKTSNGDRTPELQRAVAAVRVVIADAIPQGAESIEVTMDRSMAIAIPALTPTQAVSNTVTLQVPASWAGQTDKSVTTYTLCNDDGWTSNVRIVVKGAGGAVLADVTAQDVPVKRNHQTVMTGRVFGNGEGFATSINTEWGSDMNVTF